MTAQVEKVVLNADRRMSEQTLPHGGQLLFQHVPGSHEGSFPITSPGLRGQGGFRLINTNAARLVKLRYRLIGIGKYTVKGCLKIREHPGNRACVEDIRSIS